MRHFLSFLSVSVLLGLVPFSHYGQATSTSAPCTCDGGYTYSSTLPLPISYILTDASGAIVNSGTSNTSVLTFSNLCTAVYTLNLQSGTMQELFALNIGSTGLQPGLAVTDSICDNSPPVSLSTLLVNELAGGTWTSPSGAVHGGTYNPSADAPGLYVYSIPNGGCTVSTGVYMHEIVNANPGLSSTRAICSNFLPLNLFDQLNGTPDPGGEWLDSNGNLFNGIYDPASMDPSTFIYRINTVPGCNPVFATVTIQEDQIPNAGQNSSVLVCAGAAPFPMFNYVEGTPQSGGIWLNAMALPVDGIFDPATDPYGVYRYVVNSSALCPSASSFLTISFTATNPSGEANSINLCANAAPVNMTSALNGSPLLGGVWRNALNQIVDDSFNPANEPAGVYSYYYPNVGCSPATGNLTIQVEALPQAGPDGTDHLCSNAPQVNLFSLLPAGVPTTGVWLFNGSPINPSVVPGGTTSQSYTYQVTGTVCPADVSIHTLIFDPVNLTPPDQAVDLCASDPVQDLSALYPTFSTLVFTNAAGAQVSPILQPSLANSQVLTATNVSSNACPNTFGTVTITIEQPSFQSQTLSMDACESLGTLDLESLAPVIDYSSGSWYDASGNSISSSITLSGDQVNTYFFQANSSSQCGISELEVVISSFALPHAGSNASREFCITDSALPWSSLVPLDADVGGTWSFNNLPVADPLFEPSVDPEGLYTYTVSANGPCPFSTSTLALEIDPGFLISAGEDVAICPSSGPFTLGTTAEAEVFYSWTPAIGLSNATVANPTYTPPSTSSTTLTQVYEVEATNGTCTYSDNVTVTVYPSALPSMPEEIQVCSGETVELSSSQLGTYNWTPAELFADDEAAAQSFVPTQDVSIFFTFTNVFGCTLEEEISIVVYALPTLIFNESPVAGCPPLADSFAISNASSGVEELNWTLSGPETITGNGESWAVSLNEPGLYSLYLAAESAEGCVADTLLANWVEVFETPTANFQWSPISPSTVDNEVSFENMSFGYATSYWEIGSFPEVEIENLTWIFNENEPGEFDVCLRVENEQGCRDTLCRVIDIENESLFFMPNAFTPNNDGLNEQLKPVLLGFEEDGYEFRIFNRWGEEIFTSFSHHQGWSGEVRNGAHYAQNEVYVWQVRAKVKRTADYREYTGFVTLIR
jgi:gliding motility-associated-like protein